MKLGLLKCDSVSAPFVEQHGQYPQMFKELLHPVDSTIEWVVYDVEQGVFPESIDAVDAYVISGSRHGVNDGQDWMLGLEAFLLTLHAAKKK